MATRTEEPGVQADPDVIEGVYVYGIVDRSVTLPDTKAVGDEPAELQLITEGNLSALVSEIRIARPLGTREDLLAHERVVDSVAAAATILPMRFGGVVADVDAVREELLAENQEHFAAVLSELDGLVQFSLRGRYVEGAHLREIVEEEPEVGELREALRGLPEEEGYSDRVRLGELVNNAVVAKRENDVQVLLEALEPHVVATSVREVGGENDALSVALLVDRERIREFEEAVDAIGARWEGRIGLRLTGPLAPYDFLPEE